VADDQVGNLLAESYFEEPRWSLSHVVAWIAFRNVDALTATYEDIRSVRFGAAMYGLNSATLIIKNPLAALWKALRGGKIAAISRDNSDIPQEYWDDVGMNWETWPNVRFRRDDVLALFPSTEAPSATQTLSQPKPPLKTAPKGNSVRTKKAEKMAVELKLLISARN